MKTIVFTALCLGLGLSTNAASERIRKDYNGFTIWADCNEHATAKFRYNAGHDMADYKREDVFRLDSSLPLNCQPSSTETFSTKGIPSAATYQRAHLVAANHLDYSQEAVRDSFYMTNILPMTRTLNLGAWGRTERITECYRDRSELLILGGAVWGNAKKDRKNDYFVTTHNIRTPEFFWKVIINGDGETIAWYIPNDTKANSASLDKYLIKPAQLETKIKEKLPEVSKAQKIRKPKKSWPLPTGCGLN